MTPKPRFCRTFIQNGFEFLNPLTFDDGKNWSQALASPRREAEQIPLQFKLETESESGEKLHTATAPWVFAGSPLVVAESIRDEVLEIVGRHAQLLPLIVHTGDNKASTMWFLHTDHVVSDLDRSNSELRIVLGNRVASVKKLELTGENAPYPEIFKLSDCMDFYCYSADIAKRLESISTFVGTRFESL